MRTIKKLQLLSILIFWVAVLNAQDIILLKANPSNDSLYLGSIDDGPIVVFPGCSWYCIGEQLNWNFSASSVLAPKDSITYSAKNAHDFDINTAWIEGVPGNGIGEYLEYSIDTRTLKEPHELGINMIVLANGYKKSKTLWQANGRVKRMRMSVDKKPYANIELLDSFAIQTIDFKTIMLPQKGKIIFRFEILEVFKGTKYNDTAISDLVFDGIGDH